MSARLVLHGYRTCFSSSNFNQLGRVNVAPRGPTWEEVMTPGERIDRCIEMIGSMCRERRPPKMRIPASQEDEDVFIVSTLEWLRGEMDKLSRPKDHD